MLLYRVENPDDFDERPEVAMDVHYAAPHDGDAQDPYIVIGGRVAISWERSLREASAEFLAQSWLRPELSFEERSGRFNEWLRGLERIALDPKDPGEFSQPIPVQMRDSQGTPYPGLIVWPLHPLPPPPPRPASIYGHLPFTTVAANDTVIYRWEAFPTSRRIKRTASGGEIDPDTYGAPASEVPFAPTGFSVVGRFALPNLMPACYRWELQPKAGTRIECGASVPLYGQAGGGVEVRFPAKSYNRCPIADPVLLPAL